MTLINVRGTLRQNYKQLQPKSILHADELIAERHRNKKLNNHWFYTADGALYFLHGKNKIPTLALTRRSVNPLLQDEAIDNYCNQFERGKSYNPTPEETRLAVEARSTVLVNLTKLRVFLTRVIGGALLIFIQENINI